MDDLNREPHRERPAASLSAKMSTLARRDTRPEVALRKALHERGLRFRVQVKIPENRRRTIDIAFSRARLAVFVDGCFWHGCPEHYVPPQANAEWWRWKINLNRSRDSGTDATLNSAGWGVLRIWEHVHPEVAANLVEGTYRARLAAEVERRR